MPGFSLWLVPPDSSPLYRALSALIADILPAQFPAASPPSFVPHVTLTSDVPFATFTTSSDEAQQKRDARAWLDSLGPLLPASHDVRVRFEALDVGERFVQKLTLRVRKEGGLAQLARVSRLQGVLGGADADVAESWLEQSYRPHCSLVYGDMPISDEKKAELRHLIENAKVSVDGEGSPGTVDGWEGGTVWLVPTFKKIPEWGPWVEKAL